MRIAVCDDDDNELARLMELMKEYQLSRGVTHDCRFFHNSTEFLCGIRGGEYDLVLLDVIMPGVSGVEVARELREVDKNVKLIFLSSSPEFALESYSVGAYYYLLKPADAKSLFSLLDKAGDELRILKEQGLVLKDRKGIVRISFSELEYVEVINKTVSFHLADGEVREVAIALGDIEEKLAKRPEFIKTHRSYLVNLNYVETVDASCVVTKTGHNIPVSRQRRNQVQDACMRFLFQSDVADTQEAGTAKKQERPDGPWRILLVDDDPADCVFYSDILKDHGCMVQYVESGRDALKLAADEPYDCVLLDVMIPGEDGFAICESLRKLSDIPVIFLSCVTEADKQVEGFAAGGIEYITKDTPAELFWTKVKTRIRLSAADRTQLRFGPLLLDLAGHRALMDGKDLSLTPAEFDILWQISEQAGHIFTPEEIAGIVCGMPWDGGQQMHMSRLRRKLEKAWDRHHFIESVWGQGYRFVPPNH